MGACANAKVVPYVLSSGTPWFEYLHFLLCVRCPCLDRPFAAQLRCAAGPLPHFSRTKNSESSGIFSACCSFAARVWSPLRCVAGALPHFSRTKNSESSHFGCSS